MGVPTYLIASVVRGVLAQRLARRICPDCKEKYVPEQSELQGLSFQPPEGSGPVLYRGRGCEECRGTGYRGRLGIYELLTLDEPLRRSILKGVSASELKIEAQRPAAGTAPSRAQHSAATPRLTTLYQDAMQKVQSGQTTVQEVLRTIQADE